ncbi:F-box protein [Legionella sp. CNM-1927-20]|uniref:F-box protein n=1 Tax=Legionella sp. CNM-1927-20 TaxID=3422221 RepID=UPI00403B3668
MKDIHKNVSLFEKDLTKLPHEIRRHLFSFFNQKELKTMARVNKKFHEYCIDELKELANKYKSNIFYTVGSPIQFSENTSSHYILDLDPQIRYRKNIPLTEIYDSFSGKNIESIKLFAKEDEACEYSRFLRKGSHLNDGEEASQPAIFKVIYLSEINFLDKKQEKIIINHRQRSNTYDLNERTSDIEFFEAKRIDVIPLEGTLKIHYCEKGKFLDYGTINYSNFSLKQEENYFNFKSCTIC